jgi:hypothetical protein
LTPAAATLHDDASTGEARLKPRIFVVGDGLEMCEGRNVIKRAVGLEQTPLVLPESFPGKCQDGSRWGVHPGAPARRRQCHFLDI